MPFPKGAHLRSPVIKPSSKPIILKLLGYKNYSAQALAKEIDRLPNSVAAILRQLHRNHQVHIVDWVRSGSTYKPVWGLGCKSDAIHPRTYNKPLPAPTKPNERQQDTRRLTRNYITTERIWGI